MIGEIFWNILVIFTAILIAVLAILPSLALIKFVLKKANYESNFFDTLYHDFGNNSISGGFGYFISIYFTKIVANWYSVEVSKVTLWCFLALPIITLFSKNFIIAIYFGIIILLGFYLFIW
jgi:hypothetical protein